MSIWARASVVLAAVGVALLALATVAAAGPLRAGAEFAVLVPVFLGVGLKGILALMGAAVMAYAARLERRRLALVAERAAAEATPAVLADPEPARLPEARPRREAARLEEAA